MYRTVIYIPLSGEGTAVWRPVAGEKVGKSAYRILPAPENEVGEEQWVFPPGSIVRCVDRKLSRGRVLVAVELA